METAIAAKNESSLDNLARIFGQEEANWLKYQIEMFWARTDPDAFEFTDNFRLCLIGDELSELFFVEQELSGCCGSYEIEFGPSPLFHTYKYGFNFGH
jgi:hypothetical protein